MSQAAEPTSGPDRVDARRRELRETISAVALDLVLDRGLDTVTVDQIARAANVSRRTFFNYFPSKVAACIPDAVPPPAGEVDRFLTDRSVPTLVAMERLLWHQVSNSRRHSEVFDRFHDLWRREPGIRTEVHAILAKTERQLSRLVAVREGREDGAAEATTVAAASIAILRVAVERWRSDEPGVLLEHRIREAFETITRSVAPTAGP